jgi:hypothetical protein
LLVALSVYRCRVKVEALFSLLKRMAQGYCWSRGRKREKGIPMDVMCPAWQNEVLCKLIFMNLRTTVMLEEETGVEVDYTMPDRFFPPPAEPLILSPRRRAA